MNTIFIKNMVCDRCIMAVKNTFEQLNIIVKNIQLGEVSTQQQLSKKELDLLRKSLSELGFELIDDKKSQLIDKIKIKIIEIVHHQNNEINKNLSEILSQSIHHDYAYISNLFSEVEGITIEKYFIAQKIERVKELLVYDELSLSEIAYQLNYSSVAYLSNQFKKVTGLTPSHFKQIKSDKRKSLDKV